jgi:hypothetical protein
MKFLKFLAIMPIIAATLLFAEEEKHVTIGTRPMSEEALAQIEAEKAKNTPADEIVVEEEASLEIAGFGFDRYPPVYYSASHHLLASVTVLNNDTYALELEDGSVWKISSYDGVKALNWRNIDYLTITQNNRWFSRYNYRIINTSNGTSAEANLHIGPVELGPHSRYIVGIDHSRKEILLSDNTRYEISYLDASIFKDWALNDYLIIGTNSNTSFWDSGSDILLINVNMNNSARGKQF